MKGINSCKKNDTKIASEEQKFADELKESIEKSYQKGFLDDYILDSALELKRNSRGWPDELVFTMGGPYIFLNLLNNPGQIVVYCGFKEATAFISTDIVDEIISIYEDF